MTDAIAKTDHLNIHFLWVIVVLYFISVIEKNYQKYLFNKTINNSMNKIIEIYTKACDIAVKIHADTIIHNRQNNGNTTLPVPVANAA